MGNNSKHTESKIFCEPSRQNRKDTNLLLITKSNGNAIGKIYRDDLDDIEGLYNAERIVTMWNNWDDVLNLLYLAKLDLTSLLKEVKEMAPGSYRAETVIERIQQLQNKLINNEQY